MPLPNFHIVQTTEPLEARSSAEPEFSKPVSQDKGEVLYVYFQQLNNQYPRADNFLQFMIGRKCFRGLVVMILLA